MKEEEARSAIVVDRDEEHRETLCVVLSEVGFDVSAYPDAESALRDAPPAPVEVLIADMSPRGGTDAARLEALRRRFKPDRTLVVSTAASEIPRDLLERGDVERVLSKPLDVYKFLFVVGFRGSAPRRRAWP